MFIDAEVYGSVYVNVKVNVLLCDAGRPTNVLYRVDGITFLLSSVASIVIVGSKL